MSIEFAPSVRLSLIPQTILQDTGISNKAAAILNSFVNDIFERSPHEAPQSALSFQTRHWGLIPQISPREIRTAVRLIHR
ncbi:hypothetical protein DFP72DRAFT_1012308 [Ephemerocybe angulata]|uniref:Uncharacterized protein n=1 Tax=Ephemerocybe angulata TaxID=980116 RepID=A0A8H6HS70_9AGAR|nr:hypothetical protein DFP72DRAFT_1012306 [Tulosesus angulatus]KAF6751462.1 hypothetical protein DFP72DRAFT_1012308 [Tulosesus angulatus]